MDFEKTKTICNTIVAENMDFDKESSYKGNMRVFSNDFIKDNMDKIRFEYLFKYKKFHSKDKDFVFELFKHNFKIFMEKYGKDRFNNGYKQLSTFFTKVKLTEDELIKYLTYSYNTPCKDNFDRCFQTFITKKQKITEKVINYLYENKLIKETKNYYGTCNTSCSLYCIVNSYFMESQDLPQDFYDKNEYFKTIKQNILDKNNPVSYYAYQFLKGARYSFDEIKPLIDNSKEKYVLTSIMENKRNEFTEEQYRYILKKHIERSMSKRINKKYMSFI